MTPERWRQIERVYLDAREGDEHRRAAVLDEACAGDADLRREVEALLAQEGRAEQFLESPPSLQMSEGSGQPSAMGLGDADVTRDARDTTGLFAGRYRIARELGRGGMGVVYQAEDVRLKLFVALKFLSTELSARPEARRRFLREAQAAAALDDPHVCTVYEAGEDGGRAYIAMAFIDGPTLKDRIAGGPLSIEDTVTIARQVAAGLAAAHDRGVVHRDIKPGNVMIAGERLAKITDFGLARIEGSGDSQTAGVAGTLAYMSPEQVQGLRTDHRTDLWSLGCVIYEMLTARQPFSNSTGQTDVSAILHARLRPVAALRPDVPTSLVATVGRCLQQDVRQRYQRASDVLADLDARPGSSGAALHVHRRDVKKDRRSPCCPLRT